MIRTRGLWRWTSAIVGLVVVVAAIVLVSGHGFGTDGARASSPPFPEGDSDASDVSRGGAEW